jgi:hypothetical protein
MHAQQKLQNSENSNKHCSLEIETSRALFKFYYNY